ncbi:MAG: energy-coupling factor transporter transmembrane protein EcfT [Candidatus Improbicoccus devescovinae]|nr:MAG: energy-coupling factor transporter transmembrane protein EcfT [Candidatus Improbicoccus devescovinae]
MFFNDYIFKDTIVSKLDIRIRFFLSFLITSCLLFGKNVFLRLMILVFVIVIMCLARVNFRVFIRKMKFIFLFFGFSFFVNLWNPKGQVLIHLFEKINITDGALRISLITFLGMLILTLVGTLIFATSSIIDIIYVSKSLFSPLKIININTEDISFVVMLMFRFFPMILEEFEKIFKAQKARGAVFNKGNLMVRLKSLNSVFVPIFISCFKHAIDVAVAMECRCYGFTNSRGSLKIHKFSAFDFWAVAFTVIFLIFIFFWNAKLKFCEFLTIS